jgi:hypothetical protein
LREKKMLGSSFTTRKRAKTLTIAVPNDGDTISAFAALSSIKGAS